MQDPSTEHMTVRWDQHSKPEAPLPWAGSTAGLAASIKGPLSAVAPEAPQEAPNSHSHARIQQRFSEDLLRARHEGYSCEQDGRHPCPVGVGIQAAGEGVHHGKCGRKGKGAQRGGASRPQWQLWLLLRGRWEARGLLNRGAACLTGVLTGALWLPCGE